SHSFRLIRESGECVINLPTRALVDEVVGIGNTTGAEIDKFATFGLTQEESRVVNAPSILECCACFECRLAGDSLVRKCNFFLFEMMYARAARRPKHPETLHHTGNGAFMVSGKILSRRSKFRPELLG
ncbi:MAG: flavin reductase, partial [Methylacidiphilaceae bacterium]|nr:flavin reductase [Candidatus Methylacidiphilaceae bacterium]